MIGIIQVLNVEEWKEGDDPQLDTDPLLPYEDSPVRLSTIKSTKFKGDYTSLKIKQYINKDRQVRKILKLFNLICKKNIGESYLTLKEELRKKSFSYLHKSTFKDCLKEINSSSSDSLYVIIENKVQLRNKFLTFQDVYNPYTHTKNIEDVFSSQTDEEIFVRNNLIALAKVLEQNKYNIEVFDDQLYFSNNHIKGYVSSSSGYFFNSVFADKVSDFNKITRCPLITKIPSSNLARTSLLKEFEYLANTKDIYTPCYVSKETPWSF